MYIWLIESVLSKFSCTYSNIISKDNIIMIKIWLIITITIGYCITNDFLKIKIMQILL